METSNNQEKNEQNLQMKLMTSLARWLIGVAVLLLIPIIFPIAMIAALVYFIPAKIGGWIYDLIENWIKN